MADTENTDFDADLRVWNRIAWMKASGNVDDFRQLGEMLGYIHPETRKEMDAYWDGYRRVIGYAPVPGEDAFIDGVGGAFPPRPVWRDMEQSEELLASIRGEAPATLAVLTDEPPSELFQPDPRDEEIATLRKRVAELESAEPAPLLPAPDAPEEEDEPEAEIDPKDAETIIDGFVGELRTGRDVAEETMRGMISADRKKLFSILNGELGNLKNEEALLGKSIPRRADVESLLGILARVGEA